MDYTNHESFWIYWNIPADCGGKYFSANFIIAVAVLSTVTLILGAIFYKKRFLGKNSMR
jgi:hypothetical protein